MPRTRANDHVTSTAGAAAVEERAPNQKMRLYAQFKMVAPFGLTDEEAAELAGLSRSNFWKRCGELRAEKLIVFTDGVRKGSAGVDRRVSTVVVHGS